MDQSTHEIRRRNWMNIINQCKNRPENMTAKQWLANMIREAEKYLGYPYVWGGSSPSSSFDYSGFVSWVINNCGNPISYASIESNYWQQHFY